MKDRQTIVGFENHSGKTFLGPEARPLGNVIKGFGNNGNDSFEGVRYKNAYGTYLHGPVLPKNPHFTDLLISQALEKRHGQIELINLDDSLEIMAHQAIVKRPADKPSNF